MSTKIPAGMTALADSDPMGCITIAMQRVQPFARHSGDSDRAGPGCAARHSPCGGRAIRLRLRGEPKPYILKAGPIPA